MGISRSCKLSIPEHVRSVVFDEEDDSFSSVILLNYESGEFYSLDRVGYDFWRLVQDKKSLDEIVDTLLSMYDINADQLWTDIEELIASMSEKGVIMLLDASK